MTRLEQYRTEAAFSPEQLGELAGVAGQTIRRLEAGKGAQLATLGKLAKFFTERAREDDPEALAVKPLDLLGEVDPVSPSTPVSERPAA